MGSEKRTSTEQGEPVRMMGALGSARAAAPAWCVAAKWEKIARGWHQLIRPRCSLCSHTHRKFCSRTSQHNQLISVGLLF